MDFVDDVNRLLCKDFQCYGTYIPVLNKINYTLVLVTDSYSIQNKLEERYENFWNNLLSQNSDNIWGRNKLRAYRKLKVNFEAEKYLYTDVDKCSISTFVRVCN